LMNPNDINAAVGSVARALKSSEECGAED